MSLKDKLQLLHMQLEALNPVEILQYCSKLIRKFKEEMKKFEHCEETIRDLENANNQTKSEISSLSSRLNNVRQMLEDELDKNALFEKNNKLLENQILMIKEVLFDHSVLNEAQKAKLSFLDIPNALPTYNSTKKLERKSASLLAPFKYDETEDSFSDVHSIQDEPNQQKTQYGGLIHEQEHIRDYLRTEKVYVQQQTNTAVAMTTPSVHVTKSAGKRVSEEDDDPRGTGNDYSFSDNNNDDDEEGINNSHRCHKKLKSLQTSGKGKMLTSNFATLTNLNRSHSEPSLADDILNDVANRDNYIPVTGTLPASERKRSSARKYLTTNHPLTTWNSAGKLLKSRPHIFTIKNHYGPGCCTPCGKRLRFGARILKCKECKATCHEDCRTEVPIPCIPMYSGYDSHQAGGNTPKKTGTQNMLQLTEFIPGNPPYIPALVIHCVYAIECRGMKDVGLYRVPGEFIYLNKTPVNDDVSPLCEKCESEKDVKDLKEKFLRGKTAPCLSKIQDINVICGCLKDFLRSLTEPLITRALWQEFVSAAGVRSKDQMNGTTLLMQLVDKLPLANRDTLSFLMIHLQKIAAVPDNKMNVSSLATIFAPAIVGYSVSDPSPFALLADYSKQALVVEQLIQLPTDFWNKFINTDDLIAIPCSITNNPSSALTPQQKFNDNTPTKQKVGSSIKLPNKFFTSPRLF